MPRLGRRFQAEIAIHELGLAGSATEVVFPSVQPSHDGRALDGLAALETRHEHLKAMTDVRARLVLHPATRDVMLVRHDASEPSQSSKERGRLVFPGQDRLRDDSAFPGLHGPSNFRKFCEGGGNFSCLASRGLDNEEHRRLPELQRIDVRAIAPEDSEPFEPPDVRAHGRHARPRLAAELPERQPRVFLKGLQNPNVKRIEIHDRTSRRSSLKLCPGPAGGMLALRL